MCFLSDRPQLRRCSEEDYSGLESFRYCGRQNVDPRRNRHRAVEQRYIGRQVTDRFKRLEPIATACDDVKVAFRAEDADQAAQKHRAPVSNYRTEAAHQAPQQCEKLGASLCLTWGLCKP